MQRNVPVIQVYGSTETGPIAVYTRVGGDLSRMTSTGLPGLHCEAKVVDDDGREVPHGTTGEVIVRGPNVLYEYWGNAEATAEALRDGWYHTGDIGTRDAGRLFLYPGSQEEHDHLRRREHLSRRGRARAARSPLRCRMRGDRPPRSEMAGSAGRLYRLPQGHDDRRGGIAQFRRPASGALQDSARGGVRGIRCRAPRSARCSISCCGSERE